MTLGEIYSIIWAVNDEKTPLGDNIDDMSELYNDLVRYQNERPNG
mgnify:CR=1 FL=1